MTRKEPGYEIPEQDILTRKEYIIPKFNVHHDTAKQMKRLKHNITIVTLTYENERNPIRVLYVGSLIYVTWSTAKQSDTTQRH